MAKASSLAAVKTDWSPPQATAKVSSVVRAMLFSGSTRVRLWPPQTQAPRSRRSVAHRRLAARYFATSSKKFV